MSSCNNEEVSRTGYLDVDVRYTGGASKMELDGVKVALNRTETDNLEQTSEWITETGKQSIELSKGNYELELTGNRVKTDDLDPPHNIVIIKSGEHTPKAIRIERLPYSVVVKYKDKEMNNGDTITLSSIAALDLWNKYSSNELHWTAKIAHTLNWITFTKSSGSISGGKTDYALFEIGELPNYGHNYAEVIITSEDEGTFTILLDIVKQGGEPEKATITGDSANVCPATSVVLTANALNATSYQWYKGNGIIEEETTNKYNVTSNGTYSVIGVNVNGTGVKSDGKVVTINSCATPPAKATITGDSENTCPATSVILTATATDATSYKWYKGSSIISGETGNTYTVTQSGTYYAVGINANGTGNQSDGKAVTISTCIAVPATATISGNSTNSCSGTDGQSVTLTASATGATSYIWRNGSTPLSETGNTFVVNQTGTYYVKGVNVSGAGTESAGKTVTIVSCVPTAPTGLTAKMFGNDIYVSWNSVQFATSYKIRICDSNSQNCQYRQTTSSSYTFKESEGALFCGVNRFEVVAINTYGEESQPNTISCNRQISLSQTSVNVTVYATGESFSIQWSEVRPVGITATVYYAIYRDIGAIGNWTLISPQVTGTSFSDNISCPGWLTQVNYKVEAYVTECGGVKISGQGFNVCY